MPSGVEWNESSLQTDALSFQQVGILLAWPILIGHKYKLEITEKIFFLYEGLTDDP